MRKRRKMEPRELSKKEIKELQKQFPINKQELDRLKQNKRERLQNKLEIAVMIFWIVMLVGVLYLLYLTLTYQMF